MECRIDWEKGIVNRGSLYRLKRLMKRAMNGEKLVIGFIGGSITQGSLSSAPEKCYAYHVYTWWKNTFPMAGFEYVNGGIGGTSSQFGVARVEEDLLDMNPDFVVVDFSVNDKSTDHFMETYEGLLRKVYSYKTEPAVLLLHNVYYDNGASAERVHSKLGRHYRLPCISMQSSIYGEILAGRIENREITPDDLHPNDRGHELLASVITNFLDKVLKEIDDKEPAFGLACPMTANTYENSVRYRNQDISPLMDGFECDNEAQKDIRDCFKKGWFASENGSTLEFTVKGSGIAIQYRRYALKTAPKARVIVDGNKADAVILDGEFDLDWGDNLELTTIAEEIEAGEHSVRLEIFDGEDCEAPFYVVSVITK